MGMYKSPIDIIYGQMETQIEGDILRAVQRYGINVDKDELIRALQYDRDQYEKGYSNGKRDAMDELVRCKDCEFCHFNSSNDTFKCSSMNGMFRTVKADDFCSYGERREG